MLVFVVMSCGLVGGYQRFGGMYHLHLHGKTLLTTYKATQRHNPDHGQCLVGFRGWRICTSHGPPPPHRPTGYHK
jgi:hypothetical protein